MRFNTQYAIGFYNQHGTAEHWIKEGKKTVLMLISLNDKLCGSFESAAFALRGDSAPGTQRRWP
jgi:hypothetical protein